MSGTDTVTFATFCHPPHLERLHAPGVLQNILASHKHPFDEVLVVHQRCWGLPYRPIDEIEDHWVLRSEDYPGILSHFGLPEEDPIADEMTHGPTAPHYWKWHVINHLIALEEATSDYIVFSDCDCLITETPESPSWIEYGISILEERENVFCVSPNDGSSARYTQTMSQQMFLINVERFRWNPPNLPWDGTFKEGGPMQEYYFMLEGRIGRILTTNDWHRYVLRKEYRYWHYGDWAPEGWKPV